jgi:hypothetical protein
MQNSNTKPFYEAIYQDAEDYSYRAGWDIMKIGDTWYVRTGYQNPWIKKKSLIEAIDEGMNYERKS